MENIFCLESHIHLCSRHTSANPAYVIKTCLTWHAISGARYWGFVSPKLHVSTYRNQQHCWWFHHFVSKVFHLTEVAVAAQWLATIRQATHSTFQLGERKCDGSGGETNVRPLANASENFVGRVENRPGQVQCCG